MEAPDIIYTDGKNTCASAPVFSNIDGNVKYIRADLAEPLSVINSLPEETKDICSGCTNVKGCVTCVDENMKEFAEDKDLEKAAEEYAYTNWESDDYHDGASEGLSFDPIGHTEKCFKAGAEWQRKQIENEHGKALLYVCQKTAEREHRSGVKEGRAQAEKELGWHSVKESLPPMDEEVIVLTDDIHGKIVPDSHCICYGHIVDKNIAVDYDSWNIPGVTHWMYCPKLEEEK